VFFNRGFLKGRGAERLMPGAKRSSEIDSYNFIYSRFRGLLKEAVSF
jgi:hypothetical protein